MKYVIVGKNMEVTSSLEAAVKEKLGKLDKFFAEDTTAHVTLSINRDRHNIEVTIPVKGNVIRCEQVSNDMYTSIDQVEEVIERQLKKYKSKIVKKHKAQAAFKRNKQFEMKPMYPEDACVQMELLGHAFYVFRNAETEQINVVYKRKGGAYGLIEPEE